VSARRFSRVHLLDRCAGELPIAWLYRLLSGDLQSPEWATMRADNIHKWALLSKGGRRPPQPPSRLWFVLDLWRRLVACSEPQQVELLALSKEAFGIKAMVHVLCLRQNVPAWRTSQVELRQMALG